MVAGTSGTSVCPLLSFNPHLILVQPHPVSYQLFCRICLSLYLGKITAYRYLKPLANSHKFFLKCAAIFLSYGCISLYHIATLPLMVAVGTALLVCICQHPENIQKCGGVGVGVVFQQNQHSLIPTEMLVDDISYKLSGTFVRHCLTINSYGKTQIN